MIRPMESISLTRLSGDSVTTITGRHRIHAEHVRSLLEVTSCKISIQTQDGCLSVQGNGLHIEYYTREELQIRGLIQRIEIF